MSRRSSRKHTFALVFQLGFYTEIDVEETINKYLEQMEVEKVSEEDRDFIYAEFSGTHQNLDKIDALISENLKGWTLDRLNKVDMAILRLAVYEMLFAEDIPKSVSVNEAIEICKIYSSDDTPGFINGVLGIISTDL